MLPRDERGRRIDLYDSVLLAGAALVVTGLLLSQSLPALLAAGLLLFSQVLAVWQPLSVLFLMPVGLAFSPLGFSVGSARFSYLEATLLLGVSGSFLRLTLSMIGARDRTATLRTFLARLTRADFAGLALGLLLAGTVSLGTLANSNHVREALREWRWTILEPVLWYSVALLVLRSSQDARRLVALWVLSAAGMAFASVVLWFAGGGLAVEGVRRLAGFYPHPNAAALALERPAVVALVLAAAARAPWWFWSTAAAPLLVAVILTFSRGALLGLWGGLLVGLWQLGKRRLAGAFLLTGCLLAFVLVLLFPARLQAELWAGGDALRLANWRSSLAMIQDYPLTGVGLDQYLYQYVPRYVEPRAWSERFTSHPHNLILDFWLRLGIAGLLLLGSALWLVVRHVRSSSRDPWSVALVAGLTAGAIHGSLDRGYFSPDLAASFWLVAVILDLPRLGDQRGS